MYEPWIGFHGPFHPRFHFRAGNFCQFKCDDRFSNIMIVNFGYGYSIKYTGAFDRIIHLVGCSGFSLAQMC